MSRFSTYYDFMDKYEQFYKEVKETEEEKLSAMLSNDLSRIENSLSAYEKFIKQAQKYEEKRLALCESIGLDGHSFKNIIACFEGDEKRELIMQKKRLEILIETVSYLNKKSMEIATIQLKFSEELAKRSPEATNCYNSKGETEPALKGSNLLNKQV